MANLFELPRYLAVEGPIRVGKSTLASILAERLNAQRVMEPEENAFLQAFYEGERGAGLSSCGRLISAPDRRKPWSQISFLRKTNSLPA